MGEWEKVRPHSLINVVLMNFVNQQQIDKVHFLIVPFLNLICPKCPLINSYKAFNVILMLMQHAANTTTNQSIDRLIYSFFLELIDPTNDMEKPSGWTYMNELIILTTVTT